MAATISIEEYLAREEQQLKTWAQSPLMVLEIAMDYSAPWQHPGHVGVYGSLALRWTQLQRNADEAFMLKALLGAFFYAKVLNIDVVSRGGLFGRVQEAVRNAALVTGKSLSVSRFAKWNLSAPGETQEVVWPWNIVSWDQVNASEPATGSIDGTSISALRIYRATLLEGPATPNAPDGFWLQLSMPDKHFQRVMLPGAALATLATLLSEASEGEQRGLVRVLMGVNGYHKTAQEIVTGHEAIAVGSALRAMTIKQPPSKVEQPRVVHPRNEPAQYAPMDVLEDRLKEWLKNMDNYERIKLGRRIAVGVGVLLLAMNLLPDTGFRGSYIWTDSSRLLVGVGAALLVVGLLTKPKGESL